MKKYHSSYICFLLILSISCSKDWLDKKTDINAVIPATLQDCQALLDNAETINGSGVALQEVASGDHYLTDAEALRYLRDNDRNAYIWGHLNPYTQVFDWRSPYTKIFYANLVLETLKKITKTDNNSDEYDNIKGQALFIRSKSFFDLTQLYAAPFDPSTSKTQLGIPLKLESDVNIPTFRATVEENYNQILGDLLEAMKLMPNIQIFKTRGSKLSTLALIARVYLNMENYVKAEEFSSLCLEFNTPLVDYNTLNVSAPRPFSPFNSEVLFHDEFYYSSIRNSNVDNTLYSSYNDNDLRKKVFFTIKSGNTYGWKGNYTGSPTFFGGLAIDEVFLIRAECYARAGKVTQAMSDLNTLMRSRWDNTTGFMEFTATDAEDALKQILQERRKELLYRGLRWSDLRRLNKDSRFATALSRTLNGITYKLEPNTYKYIFPIPDDIIQQSGIQQNPGWVD